MHLSARPSSTCPSWTTLGAVSVLLLPWATGEVRSHPIPGAEDEPVRLEPGCEAVRGRELDEHEVSYTLFLGEGEARQKMQQVHRTFAYVTQDEERRLRITWTTAALGREVVDRLDVEARTLAPRARQIPLPTGGEARIEIDGKRVVGATYDAGGDVSEAIDATFAEPLIEPSPALLACLRFSKGARFRGATLPLELGSGVTETTWTVLEAERKERVRLPDGRRPQAWVVRVETDGQPATMRLWVARSAPYVLRKEVEMPGVGRITWEIEEDGSD